MSILICSLQGVRGRSMDVYDNKCVITTDVTLGSLITNNALDGMKTVFFADVVGVQYKRSGATIGYLQLETPSGQMNNKSSNMFSENTFTFDVNVNTFGNSTMDAIHDFIVDRLEAYKYGGETDITKNPPVNLLNASGITFSPEFKKIKEDYLATREQKIKEEKKRKKIAEEQHYQELRAMVQNSGDDNPMMAFIAAASTASSFVELGKIWKEIKIQNTEISEYVTNEINSRIRMECIYGRSAADVKKFLNKLTAKYC